ncbi:MAG: hypothetical protein P8M07_08690 [Flavobacteriales bacterium]|nr:hypothetical protein [Flavobacteriales bacterium]
MMNLDLRAFPLALFFLAILSFASASLNAQSCDCPPLGDRPVETLTDNAGLGTGSRTLTCDTLWLLDGFVYVNDGDSLTVDPGTIIQAKEGQGFGASALITARGGKILADGTADCPIVFTFDGDPVNGSMPYNVNGLWGGLILNGNGILNTMDGDDWAEGIVDDSGANRDVYGGSDNADDSGVLRYVSIRHGGSEMPNPPVNFNNVVNGDETNGLSLNGVGSATIIDNLEVVSTLDDGIQIMGGAVNMTHVAIAFSTEDNLEYDQGWVGNVQYLFSVLDQAEMTGEHGGDYEGDDFEFQDVTLSFLPYTNPLIINQTSFGHAGATGIRWHNGGGGRIQNSIWEHWQQGIDFEDNDPCDAYELFLFGELTIRNNRFWDIGDSTSLDEMVLYEGPVWNGAETIQTHFVDESNLAEDQGVDAEFNALAGVIVDPLNPIPTSAANVPPPYIPLDPFFEQVDYVGAFAPDQENWLAWSYLNELQLFGSTDLPGCTYSFACNFDASANLDDGTCELASCAGCTYPDADNYDPSALLDNGSCTGFSGTNSCPTDIDGDGSTTVSDLLTVLALFGEACN